MTHTASGSEFPTRWRAACAYALLAGVAGVTVALPIAAFWRDEPLVIGPVGAWRLFEGQAVLGGFLILWFALQCRAGWREFLRMPPRPWRSRLAEGVRTGVHGWLVTMVVMVVLGMTAQAAGVRPHAGFAELMLSMVRQSLALRVTLIVTAMIVEETFFRAFLQPRVGIVVATLWFAASHVNYGSPTMGAGVFVIGWVLGTAFRRTGDLAVCAVAHGTFDAIQLLVVLPTIASRL